MAEISIEIKPNGEVELKVDGVKGASCMDLTKFLEEALGEVVDRQHTSEYFENEVTETVSVGSDE